MLKFRIRQLTIAQLIVSKSRSAEIPHLETRFLNYKPKLELKMTA